MTKRIIALLLSLLLVLALFTACRKTDAKSKDKDSDNEESTAASGGDAQSGDDTQSGQSQVTPGDGNDPDDGGDPEAAAVWAEVQDAMSEVESMELEYDVPVDLTINMGGLKSNASIHVNMIVETRTEPTATHTKGTIGTSLFGAEQEVETELYQFYEDGNLVSYTWDPQQETFIRTVEEDVEDPGANPTENFTEEEYQWTMEETDDAYVLTCELTEEQMEKLFSSIGDASSTSLPVDITQTAEPVVIHMTVNKQTMLIEQITMDLSSVVTAAYAASEEMEGIDVTADAPVTFTFRRYNEIGEITAPTNYVEGENHGA